jgi:hypothetical protein
MTKYIDEAFWRSALTKPDWYILLQDDFMRLEKLAEEEKDKSKRKQIKREAYEMVEQAVIDGTLPLATSGNNLDEDRKQIDTIVIHHTKNQSGMTLERLNAMHLLRIYGMYYANPTDEREVYFKGQPVWSGHYYNEQQVFWGYHWLVRVDGTTEQILKDEYIGWHAGNWDTNTRSIGICIDDDLTDKEPSSTEISSEANVNRKHYPSVSSANIVGHCDVNKQTECPGHLFHKSWQQKLQEYIA